jgi:hypothetical protein
MATPRRLKGLGMLNELDRVVSCAAVDAFAARLWVL